MLIQSFSAFASFSIYRQCAREKCGEREKRARPTHTRSSSVLEQVDRLGCVGATAAAVAVAAATTYCLVVCDRLAFVRIFVMYNRIVLCESGKMKETNVFPTAATAVECFIFFVHN